MRRFYHGFVPALIHAPISRFGDTAANAGMPMYVQCVCHKETNTSVTPHMPGVLALFDQYPGAREVPIIIKTAGGSVASAVWRVGLMP